jgi:hypothetical protein
MKNIERALGYELERNADGGVFLQKEELDRINARLNASVARQLQKHVQVRAAKIAQLEQQVKALINKKGQLLTKKEFEQFKGQVAQPPTQSF